MRLGILPFPVGAAYADLERSWLAAEDAGFDALWTVDHATATAELRPAWEASSLLVAMAARTRTIPVGVLVFDVLLRHPFMVAGAVAVAQALSSGRVRLGIGIGDKFSRLDHAALRIPFPPFLERTRVLEACCRSLPLLWRGETVTDPVLGLNEASLGLADIPVPPLTVGGGSTALMNVAARYAQGWNLFTQDPEAFAARLAVLEQVETSIGRTEPLAKSVYFFVEHNGRDLPRRVEAFQAAGADEVMLVLREPGSESILRVARQLR